MKIGMMIGCAIEYATGIACIVLGTMIWKKRKISLIHDYHYRNVKQEDLSAFARSIGIGIILIGAGIGITGTLDLLGSSFWWAPMLAGFVFGSVVIFRALKKYNGSVFS